MGVLAREEVFLRPGLVERPVLELLCGSEVSSSDAESADILSFPAAVLA